MARQLTRDLHIDMLLTAQLKNMSLDIRVKFLNYQDFINVIKKSRHQLIRERKRRAYLKKRRHLFLI